MSRSLLVLALCAGALFASCVSSDDISLVPASDGGTGRPDASTPEGTDAGPPEVDAGSTDTCRVSGPALGEFQGACSTDADCLCPFACAVDPTQVHPPKGICARRCATVADCPAIGTTCHDGACVTNVCTPAGGAFYGPCDAQGTGDGTCIPREGASGELYGQCLQSGSATTACRWPTNRQDTPGLCGIGALCLADGNTTCETLCDPTVAEDALCPFGTVCKTTGDPVREFGVCKALGPSGCTVNPAYGTELSHCTKDSDCACPQRCVRDPKAGYSVCETPCTATADCPVAYTVCAKGACAPNYCFTTPLDETAPGTGFGLPCDATGPGDGVCVPVPGPNPSGGASTFAYGICLVAGTAATHHSCSPYFLGLPQRSAIGSLCGAGDFCFLNFSTFASTCGAACDPTERHPCNAGESCFTQVTGVSVPGQLIGACGPCGGAAASCFGGGECCSGACDAGSHSCQ